MKMKAGMKVGVVGVMLLISQVRSSAQATPDVSATASVSKVAVGGSAAEPNIPSLPWTKRSDWLDVKTDVTPAAVGDGVADDTAAIQAAFDTLKDSDDSLKEAQSRVVYFPPGRYRITKTLTIEHSTGGYVVGHGRDTVLLWDGEKGGCMFWSNGAEYIRYEGLTFDGQGVAGIGVEHRSMSYYETALSYQYCAFLNCTEHGLVVGRLIDGKHAGNASAEFWFNHCLFRHCGNGVSFLDFNDYDNSFDACDFLDCGIGVNSTHGNFDLRACHFERNHVVDACQMSPSHASSLRLCTSVGSHRFFETGSGAHQSFTIEDCQVDGWTGTDGAIVLGQRGPTTIFDCVFTHPPDSAAPIRLANPAAIQQVVVLSNNESRATQDVLDAGPNSRVNEIPAGKIDRALHSATQSFLNDSPAVPGKVFDAKQDFGAKGDGHADDTEALQKCIEAAKDNGHGAIAYLPGGSYCISHTLNVTGANYSIGSVGFRSNLKWTGGDAGVMLAVEDPQNVTLEHMALYQAPKAVVQVRQTSKGGKSSVYYDGLYTGVCGPNGPGLELVDLPEEAVVNMGRVIGPVHVMDCGRATVLGGRHYYELTISGNKYPKTGFTGFLFHNDAVHGYALEVKDDQNVVIGDFYSESNQQYLLAEGAAGESAGSITIGAKKICTLKQEAVTIHNYAGRIFIGGGDVYNQSNDTQPVAVAHTGDRPLDFLLVGNSYWNTEPLYSFGPGLQLVSIGNILIQNKYPEYAEKTVANQPVPMSEKAQAEVAASFDDFRKLARVYLGLRE